MVSRSLPGGQGAAAGTAWAKARECVRETREAGGVAGAQVRGGEGVLQARGWTWPGWEGPWVCGHGMQWWCHSHQPYFPAKPKLGR